MVQIFASSSLAQTSRVVALLLTNLRRRVVCLILVNAVCLAAPFPQLPHPVTPIRLKAGMVFNLSVGLQEVPLSPSERKGSGAEKMETFSVVIAGRYGM